MKHLRKFPDAETRDEVLAIVEYGVLSYTEGFGIKVKSEGSGPAYSTPFYVENITNEAETLTIAGYAGEHVNYLEIPVEYSTDGTNWSSWGITGATSLTRTLQPGDKLYLRATTDVWYNYYEEYGEESTCNISGISKVGGNIMSLLYGSNFTGNETSFPQGSVANFASIFSLYDEDNVIPLLNASELVLPATILTNTCYAGMFYGCASLTTSPVLPATVLARGCYSSMFDSCAALTTAPELPATTLADDCYAGMFAGCTSLTAAPALPATTLADNCYTGMFAECTSLTAAPALPATTLADNCYSYMFGYCTSLTTAPELPATTLASSCYYQMFEGCTALTTAPAILPATTLAENCYWNMFNGCSSLATAPALPATTLVDGCYGSMFYSCTNLNYIKCLAIDTSALDCTSNWVYDIPATGIFVKNPNMSGWETGENGIPSGWTVQDAA